MTEQNGQHVVEMRGVRVERDRVLLEDIDWVVNPGEHWVILGRNGAGKTLLLSILAGYLWPTAGRVRVLGERYGAVDLRDLRRRMGWITPNLADRLPRGEAVRDVILSGVYASFGLYREPSAEVRDRAGELAAMWGLSPDQRFESLSAGERQRCLLARALINNPDLLIMDEPFSGLDLAARERILAQINRMTTENGRPTVIMVTHRVSEIGPGFTHGLLLHRGRQASAGPLAEVLTDTALSAVMEIPVRLTRHGWRWQVSVADPSPEAGDGVPATRTRI